MNLDHKYSHGFFEATKRTWVGRHLAVFGATHLIWLMIGVIVGIQSWSSLHLIFVPRFDLIYLLFLILPAWGVTMLISVIVKRVRPYLEIEKDALIAPFVHTASFPSGHATMAFSLLALSVDFTGLWPYMLAAAIIVALSRVAAGMHFISDVIAGALIGFFITRAVEIGLILVIMPFK
jgi:membrane-associated phospholipid phosphatase